MVCKTLPRKWLSTPWLKRVWRQSPLTIWELTPGKVRIGWIPFFTAFSGFSSCAFFLQHPFSTYLFSKIFHLFSKVLYGWKHVLFPKHPVFFFNASLWLTRMKFLCSSYFICCCLSYLSNQFVTVQSFDNSWQRDYTNIWMQLWIQSYIFRFGCQFTLYIWIFIWDLNIYIQFYHCKRFWWYTFVASKMLISYS